MERYAYLTVPLVITDVGAAPYDLVYPILKKMNAQQVAEIEKKCPQIRSRSEDLWRLFISKDFPNRPIPESHHRRTYGKYFREKEALLKDASSRLRESLQRFKQEKESMTITALEVDPRSSRGRTIHRRAPGGAKPSGSRLIQRAMQSARSKGPVFSPRNTQFHKIGSTSAGAPPSQMRAPRGPAAPAPAAAPRPTTTLPIKRPPPAGGIDRDNIKKPAVSNKEKTSETSNNLHKKAVPTPTALKKKPVSSIFMPRRK